MTRRRGVARAVDDYAAGSALLIISLEACTCSLRGGAGWKGSCRTRRSIPVSTWSGAPQLVHVGAGADLIPGDPSTAGHGTLVAALIADSAPSADVEPIRMGGTDSTEWDALHALARAVDIDADVVTLSYRQILVDQPCAACGLVRQAARSEVFEKIVDWAVTAGGQDRAVLVAAGNDGVGVIARPASYSGAIPVTALDTTRKSLASFANWDASGQLSVIALPGDDVARGTQTNRTYAGTSFATAYAAALYAEAMARTGTTNARHVTTQLCSGASVVSYAAVPTLI
ncbi:MAG: Subtilase family [Actinomycetia bacterium]|nr:Subtilase family [Actinomycetes bacterium]